MLCLVDVALEWRINLRSVLPDLDVLLPEGDLLAPFRANADQYGFVHLASLSSLLGIMIPFALYCLGSAPGLSKP